MMGKGRCSRCSRGSEDRQSWRPRVTCATSLATFHGTALTQRYIRYCDLFDGLRRAHCCVMREVALLSPSFACSTANALQHRHTAAERPHDMAQQQDDVIDKIRAYSKDADDLRDDPMELDGSNTETRLAQTVRELRARVEEQQAALETVWHRSHR